MAQQTLNLGTGANTGDGDSLRAAGQKINDNFTELYARANILAPTGSLTLYVATTGSDSNDGLTVGTPFLTVNKGLSEAAKYISFGITVTVQVADGTYSTPLIRIPRLLTTGQANGALILQGNPTTPANCVLSAQAAIGSLLFADGPLNAAITGFRLVGNATTYAIDARSYARVAFSAIEFSTGFTIHLLAGEPSTITAAGNYSISGGAASHVYAANNGFVNLAGRTVTVSGSPAWSSSFVDINRGAVLQAQSMTFSGTASTGQRYFIWANGVVYINSVSTTYFPGSIAGVIQTGGQYL